MLLASASEYSSESVDSNEDDTESYMASPSSTSTHISGNSHHDDAGGSLVLGTQPDMTGGAPMQRRIVDELTELSNAKHVSKGICGRSHHRTPLHFRSRAISDSVPESLRQVTAAVEVQDQLCFLSNVGSSAASTTSTPMAAIGLPSAHSAIGGNAHGLSSTRYDLPTPLDELRVSRGGSRIGSFALPTPSQAVAVLVTGGNKIIESISAVSETVRDARLELQVTRAGVATLPSESVHKNAVFGLVWWTVYIINMLAIVIGVFAQPWTNMHLPSVPVLAALAVLSSICTILVTDMSADFICVALALCCPSQKAPKVSRDPATPLRTNKYLVVYCLKSTTLTDVKETLMFLQASWRLNQTYKNATYCILSGTQDDTLAAAERTEIAAYNQRYMEEGGRCYYVRRMRSVLYKYGQYLDFIMLLNGFKMPMLYKDVKSNHPSGLCFDPASDADFFCGSDFEFLAIMDRDNMLSSSFFDTANNFFTAYSDLQILQPAVTPFPKYFRRSLNGGENYYMSWGAKFQVLGNELADYRRTFIKSAAFWGKGIIRRSAYNKTLLGFDRSTETTKEEQNIPRDLISHDIIESSVMVTMLAPEIAVYEDFPQTHLEWHIRQSRWDLGDIIISKYLYPFSFGLIPNILSKFSYSHVRNFYKAYFDEMGSAIYTSTFNIRCIMLKPAVMACMVIYLYTGFGALGLGGVAVFINAQILLLPAIVSLVAVKQLTLLEKLLLEVHVAYMGCVDIMYGSCRCLRCLWKLTSGKSKWRTFEALGNSPFQTMLRFAWVVQVELTVTAVLMICIAALNWGNFTTSVYIILAFLGVIITFPAYTFVSTFKTRGSASIPTDEDPLMVTALKEVVRRINELSSDKCATAASTFAGSRVSSDTTNASTSGTGHNTTAADDLRGPASSTTSMEMTDSTTAAADALPQAAS